jgi:hypothetical protein
MSMNKELLPSEQRDYYDKLYSSGWDIGEYYFVGVKPRNPEDITDPGVIEISIRPGVSVPDNYSDVHVQIEHSITVLKVIFAEGNKALSDRFQEYFMQLAGIARASLGQDQVIFGTFSLQAFHYDVMMREGSRIKNKYIIDLGLWAILFGGAAYAAYLMSESKYLNDIVRDRTFYLMLVGSMLGTWLSFSIRKPTLSFTDLAIIEQDRLKPQVRLLFVAGLTIMVALFFGTGMVSIKIGSFETDFLPKVSPVPAAIAGVASMRAILIGCLCGIGEQLLPNAVGQRAAAFVGSVGSGIGSQISGSGTSLSRDGSALGTKIGGEPFSRAPGINEAPKNDARPRDSDPGIG